MMKKGLILMGVCLLVSLSLGAAFSQNAPEGGLKTGTLTVLIDGFGSDKGRALIALFNSMESYENNAKPFRRWALPIRDRKAEWVLRDLPFGEYAIKVFHDENGNYKLDMNLFGAPTEAYGFSNNARGTMGPPDYEKAMFRFGETDMTIRITVQ